MSAPDLDQPTLHRLMTYDPLAGEFTWRARDDVPQGWNTRYAGKRCGYDWRASDTLTYRCIRIFDWPFLGHRLAHLYMLGSWPSVTIDHRDLNGLNNRWENLRPATKGQNAANTPAPRTSSTGVKGVGRAPKGRFRAYITINRRQVWLGYHQTIEAAAAAFRAAALTRYGEFERTL